MKTKKELEKIFDSLPDCQKIFVIVKGKKKKYVKNLR